MFWTWVFTAIAVVIGGWVSIGCAVCAFDEYNNPVERKAYGTVSAVAVFALITALAWIWSK